MKPSKFEYHAPNDLADAVDTLSRLGEDAKVLAGGQSLVPLMNLRLAAPAALIDLNRVPELAYIREEAGEVRIGAMTRHRDVQRSSLLRSHCPLLSQAAGLIGYPAIRERGTIGGSLAHADPASELPCVAVTLDASLVLTGPNGSRTVSAEDFFVTHFTTSVSGDEILSEIRFPILADGDRCEFQEFARKSGDFAIAAVATHMKINDGEITSARIGIAGAADKPLRLREAEAALVGQQAGDSSWEQAGAAAAQALDASAAEADGGYRRKLVSVLTKRTLAAAGASSAA